MVEDGGADAPQISPVLATHQVANRPIAHHVIDALEAAGVERIVVASSSESASTVHQCVATRPALDRAQLQFVHQDGPLELGSALRLVAPIVNDAPCIVHIAGGLLAEPLSALVESLDGGPDAVLMVHQAAPPDQRLSRSTQSLLHLAELDPSRSALGIAGVWGFGPGGLRSVVGGRQPGAINHVPPGGPSRVAPIDLTALADRIAFGGGMLRVRLVDVWRSYRGDANDLLELNRLVLDQIEADPPHGGADGNRIEGRVRVHERASVKSTVIVGPVVIGPDARISDAYIGPYTAIGAGAHIEGAEIERSIISAGASVTHIGSRMTASIVGPNARLFRDFSLPRALRVRIGDGAEVGLC